MTQVTQAEALTEDAFLGGRLRLLQPVGGLRAGLDAVFLAAACPARAGERVIEAGCGTGAASLCLATRVEGLRATGVEIDPELVRLANANAERNGLAENFRAVRGDVTARRSDHAAASIPRDHFDHAIANPPFDIEGQTSSVQTPSRKRACTMPAGGLERWVRFLATALHAHGTLTLIHRASALSQVLDCVEGRFGAVEVIPLFPREGEPAIRIIVRGRKGSRAPLSLLPGLILHERNGAYTREAEAVLRHAQALDAVMQGTLDG